MKKHLIQSSFHGSRRIAALLLLLGTLHVVSHAQEPVLPPSGQPGREVPHKVKAFLQKAEAANRREIQLAQIAEQKATDPAVRDYAQNILNDHRQLAGDLRPLLSTRMVKLGELDSESADARRLAGKGGREFDATFAKMMAEDHEDAVRLFTNAAKNDDDPLVQSFAAQYVGKLSQHLAAGKALEKTLR